MLFRRRPQEKPDYDIEEVKKKLRETEFEKNDTTALIIAALITIIPVVLLMIAAIVGVLWLIFIR